MLLALMKFLAKNVARQSDDVFLLQNIEAHRAIMFLTHNLEGAFSVTKEVSSSPCCRSCNK